VEAEKLLGREIVVLTMEENKLFRVRVLYSDDEVERVVSLLPTTGANYVRRNDAVDERNNQW